MNRKFLSPTYLAFSCSRLGPIVLWVAVPVSVIYFMTNERDPVLLLCVLLTCAVFVSYLCISEYFRLKKNIHLCRVILEDEHLRIDDVIYQSDQIDQIASVRLVNALDKYYLYLVEIKMVNGDKHYFLDKPMNWRFESPTIRLLKRHNLLSTKVNNQQVEKDGFSSLYG
ncbi:hypothetical protein M472_01690 [Sphingobacterium paucimobilis HER1398]|uniref:Uncharacterized protein n=1 Tax=Sphingobacterium paucimobilis HER1398 TaxID=1346330 RepID=U2IXP1_9SPHI|nr:hypothetical protein M472_01690 [Sphingobacterium paucimobilis HER1398]